MEGVREIPIKTSLADENEKLHQEIKELREKVGRLSNSLRYIEVLISVQPDMKGIT